MTYRLVCSSSPSLDGLQGGVGGDLAAFQQRQGVVDSRVSGLEVLLYSGRVARGPLAGARAILKAYPPPLLSRSDVAGVDVDALVDNEVAMHARLQEPSVRRESPHLAKLLGQFKLGDGAQASAGQRWLVFHRFSSGPGPGSAGAYCVSAASATAEGAALGEGDFFDMFDIAAPIRRRKIFILKVLAETLRGLGFLHENNCMHQALGVESVLLSTTEERDAALLRCRLYDLALSVDASDAALLGGATLGELWDNSSATSSVRQSRRRMTQQAELWRRAKRDGARDPESQRAYGKADDMYLFGLFMFQMVFLPLCPPGTVTLATIQRLLEVTFHNDMPGLRVFVEQEDDWREAAAFMAAGDGAGWNLLEASVAPAWRSRPTVADALAHPFLKGASLS